MNRMASLLQGDGGHDRNLVLRSPTCVSTGEISAEVNVIQLDLSPQKSASSRSLIACRILLCSRQALPSLTSKWRLSSSMEIPALTWPIRSND